ncbi:MAG: orotidine-5'-phosphate decarboxylase [Chloroflexi bacterium]|nr:orotidine-5'-phosphate decarboxylase [Chloroflexota bacterium]
MTNYLEKLHAAQEQNNSWLCLGLDPQPELLPIQATHQWDEPVLPFCKAIVDATADLVCAYKPNLGFFLQWGASGIIALERIIAYIPRHIPVIVDCKAGDIGHTQGAWARGILDEWQADGMTVNGYVGAEAVLPVVQNRPNKVAYVLARTSNPSAADFQGDFVQAESLSRRVLAARPAWQTAAQGAIGVVMGSTYPAELELARQLDPDVPFLIPGIGAQGGELATAVRVGADSATGPLISASRSILYASQRADFAEQARAAAMALRDEINTVRAGEQRSRGAGEN